MATIKHVGCGGRTHTGAKTSCLGSGMVSTSQWRASGAGHQ
jgi:hypothetical protein